MSVEKDRKNLKDAKYMTKISFRLRLLIIRTNETPA